MAEKRMFTKKIVDSDDFLDMPLSTQCLYFHLNMRADDDGFVNNPKRIKSYIGASDDDLKLLIAKRFLICFETGVIVIKHWRMHNTLRKDRHTPTQYQELLDTLDVKDNKAYTERPVAIPATTWQPDGNQMATQDREDKDRLVESREEKVRINYQRIADLYNEICVSYPRLRSLSEARKKTIKARMNTYTEDDFRILFEKAEASSFMKGQNKRKWRATFDWMICDANMAKVLDGNYDDSSGSHGQDTDYGNPEDFYNE